MFPQRGEGFIWERICINADDNVVEATILVPESRKFHHVSFPIAGLDKKWKDWAIPTTAIAWEGVGQRDYSRPIPLQGVRRVDSASPVQPEFDTESKFRSVLLFPQRPDLIEYVGPYNAWSPFVGTVLCDQSDHIERGKYCVGYVVRERNTSDSAFRVLREAFKFPEGFCSADDEQRWKGLEREIELAREEEKAKSKTTFLDEQLLPVFRRPDHPQLGGVDMTERRSDAVIKTVMPTLRWEENRSPEEIRYIMAISDFVKAKRCHEIIVYKKARGGKGFVGYTPLIGSIVITAGQHKNTDQLVEVGQNLYTRVEYNKIRMYFSVDSVSEIKEQPFIDFTIRPNSVKKGGGDELLLHCTNLDLSTFSRSEQNWNGRSMGFVTHPDLQKVFIFEDQIGEWKDKRVSAKLLHYEGIEQLTPGRLRLVVESIDGPAIETFARPDDNDDFTLIGAPDELESDESESDEGTDYDEVYEKAFAEEEKERKKKIEKMTPMQRELLKNTEERCPDGFDPPVEPPNPMLEKLKEEADKRRPQLPPIPVTSCFYPIEVTEEDYAEDTARAIARGRLEAEQQSQKQQASPLHYRANTAALSRSNGNVYNNKYNHSNDGQRREQRDRQDRHNQEGRRHSQNSIDREQGRGYAEQERHHSDRSHQEGPKWQEKEDRRSNARPPYVPPSQQYSDWEEDEELSRNSRNSPRHNQQGRDNYRDDRHYDNQSRRESPQAGRESQQSRRYDEKQQQGRDRQKSPRNGPVNRTIADEFGWATASDRSSTNHDSDSDVASIVYSNKSPHWKGRNSPSRTAPSRPVVAQSHPTSRGYDRPIEAPRPPPPVMTQPPQRQPTIERGLLVAICDTHSIIYSLSSRQLAEYHGNLLSRHFTPGDSVEFETGQYLSNGWLSIIEYNWPIRAIEDLLPHPDMTLMSEGAREVVIAVRATLFPDNGYWECEHAGIVYLNEMQTTVKMPDGENLPIKRLYSDQYYRIWIRFDVGIMRWLFEAMQADISSIPLKPEDDIDIQKREAMEQFKREQAIERDRKEQERARLEWQRQEQERQKRADLPHRPRDYEQDYERGYGRRQEESHYARPHQHVQQQQQLSRTPSHHSMRSNALSQPSRRDEPVYMAPPSVQSNWTAATDATVVNEKKKKMERSLAEMKKMLKHLYENERVRDIIRDENFFLYQCVEDSVREWEEDDAEQRVSRTRGSRR